MKKNSYKSKIWRISTIWIILSTVAFTACSPSAIRTGSKSTKKASTHKQIIEISADENINEFEKIISKEKNENSQPQATVLPPLERQLEMLSNEQTSMKNQIANLQQDIEEIRYTLDEIKNSLQKSNIVNKKQVIAGIPVQEDENLDTENKPQAASVLLSDEEASKSFIQRNKKVETKTNISKTPENKNALKTQQIKVTSNNSNKRQPVPEPKPVAETAPEEKSDLTQALSLINQKQYDKAIQEINDLLNKTKSEAIRKEATYWLAESHIQLGNYEQAIELLTDLNNVTKSDKAPEIALKLAECKLKIGRIAEAKNTYKQIIEKYPKSEQVPKARKMLQQM